MKERADGGKRQPVRKERRQNARDFWRGFLVTFAVVMPVFLTVHFMTGMPVDTDGGDTLTAVDSDTSGVPLNAVKSYNLLWVLADSDTNNLLSVAVLRLDVENYRVVLTNIPKNSVMLDAMSPAGMMSVYSQRGALGVKNAIEETMGIPIDGYMSLGTVEMTACTDRLGDISFTLSRQLEVTNADGMVIYSKEAGTSMFSGNDIAKLIIYGNYDGTDLMRLHESLWEAFFNEHGAGRLADEFMSLYTGIVNDISTNINSAGIGTLAQAVGTVCRQDGTQLEIVRPEGEFVNGGYEFSEGADERMQTYFGKRE